MPYYWSQIETLENLQYVAGLVDGFNQDRFLAALMGKRSVGKDKIVHMRNELVEITNKLEEEYLVLEHFEDVKVKIVDNFEDIKIKIVEHFEGVKK